MTPDLSKLPDIFSHYPQNSTSLITVLQDIQREYHYLPREALIKTSEALDVKLSKVFSVATFYNAFSLIPRGKHTCRICLGTACHIGGATLVLEQAETELGIKAGKTTPDMRFTLETVACVGACAMAPVVIIDEKYHGNVRVDEIRRYLKKA